MSAGMPPKEEDQEPDRIPVGFRADKDVMDWLDAYAKSKKYDRSEAIRYGLRWWMDEVLREEERRQKDEKAKKR